MFRNSTTTTTTTHILKNTQNKNIIKNISSSSIFFNLSNSINKHYSTFTNRNSDHRSTDIEKQKLSLLELNPDDIINNDKRPAGYAFTFRETRYNYSTKKLFPTETYTPIDLNDRITEKMKAKAMNKSSSHSSPGIGVVGSQIDQNSNGDILDKMKMDPLKNYKDLGMLSHFLTTMGYIKNRNETRLSLKNQKKLGKAIKRAQFMGLIPFEYNLNHSPYSSQGSYSFGGSGGGPYGGSKSGTMNRNSIMRNIENVKSRN